MSDRLAFGGYIVLNDHKIFQVNCYQTQLQSATAAYGLGHFQSSHCMLEHGISNTRNLEL